MSRKVLSVKRVELSSSKVVALSGVSLRKFGTSSVVEAAKTKKKGFSSAMLREFFGKNTQEKLMGIGKEAPVAQKISHRQVRHNQALRDDYFYMTNIHEDKMAQDYLSAEDSFCRYRLQKEYAQYAKVFEKEIASQSENVFTETPAERVGDYLYYAKFDPVSNMTSYCRKKNAPNAPEQVLLDVAEMSKYLKKFNIGTMKVSGDQSRLMALLDTRMDETYDVLVKDLAKEEAGLSGDLPVTLTGVCNAEWSPDGKSIFYTEPDERKRPYRIYRHTPGTLRSSDELIFEEKDDMFFVDVSRTKDRKYMCINSNSKNMSELRLFDPSNANAKPLLVMSKQKNTEFFLDHVQSGFIMVTADGATDANYRIMRCAEKDISNMKQWQELLPASPKIKIDDIDVFNEHIVVYERHQGALKIRVLDLNTLESKYIALPSEIGHIEPGSNLDADATTFRFTFSAPTTPGIVYDYHFKTGELEVIRTLTVPKAEGARQAFNSEDYTVRRVFVPSSGGASVPMTLVHRQGIQPSADTPTLITAYGAYGHNLDTPFDVALLPLLERGWCIALAHVRGGGELGLKWYHSGRVLQKKNTFEDLTNCIQWLFDERITSGQWLVGKAASAGGLPFAVLANEHPGMFKALVLKAPFLDVVNTMTDDALPLTIHEYDEWGNPNNKECFEYMYSYDPYWNLRAQEYPHMYIQSSALDIRVPCWNHSKYVAKLRSMKTDKNELLLRLDSDFGHFGDSSERGIAKTVGEEYSFIYGALNIVPSRL